MKFQIKLKRYFFLSLLAFSLVSCKPLNFLYKEIKELGFITYTTPLRDAGPGTLLGGNPKGLKLVAPPEACFPKEVQENKLLRVDSTTIAQKEKMITTSGKGNVKLFNMLSMGNASIGAGASFNKVQTVVLTMKGVHIEYFDSVQLSYYYHEEMSETCKDFLDRFGFIIQAIKVEELVFQFYDKSGVAIKLDLDKLEKILELDTALDFSIENKLSLVIKTPKYIGYQLGRLIRQDNGLSIYRASKTRFGKFYFESLDLFSEEREEFFDRSRSSQIITNKFKMLEIEDEIEENSVLINL